MTSLSGIYIRIGGVTETSEYTHFDSVDSCSVITSPVCCQVTLVGCILLFTGPIVMLSFVSVMFSPHLCFTQQLMSLRPVFFSFPTTTYLNIMLNNFSISLYFFFLCTKRPYIGSRC